MFDKLDRRLPMPCLFYPAVRALGCSVADALTKPELQADILVEIGRRYPVSAVVRMTELWCEAAAFGMAYEIRENDFPRLGQPLCEDAEELAALPVPPVVNPVTAPLIEAVRLAAPRMEKPLVVGVTGPFTICSVLNGSEDFMMNCMTDDETVHSFLEKVTEFLTAYILAYRAAGASAVMIAEPSVAMVSPDMVREFSNHYLRILLERVQSDTFPVIYHNCGSVNQHLDAIAELPARAFHFGSDVDLTLARRKLPEDAIVMGNLDPRLFLSPAGGALERQAAALVSLRDRLDNFILSTGCDLSPAAKSCHLAAFFSAVSS